MIVSPDSHRAVAGHYRVLKPAQSRPREASLRGLEAKASYRVSGLAGRRRSRLDRQYRDPGGDELMRVGLLIASDDPDDSRNVGDFTARLFDLEAQRPLIDAVVPELKVGRESADGASGALGLARRSVIR